GFRRQHMSVLSVSVCALAARALAPSRQPGGKPARLARVQMVLMPARLGCAIPRILRRDIALETRYFIAQDSTGERRRVRILPADHDHDHDAGAGAGAGAAG